MSALIDAAAMALKTSLNLKPSESVMILTDDLRQPIGEAIYQAALPLARETVLVLMPPAKVNGAEPPSAIAEMMTHYDVVICPTTKSVTHTDARRNACKAGARVATMPGITEDIMLRTLNADYRVIAERTKRVTAVLDAGKMVHIITSNGTDLWLSIDGIKAISSTGLIPEPGQGGNLPSGESFLRPLEGTARGVLVVDASMAGLGKIKGLPIRIDIEDGYAVKITGGEEALLLQQQLEPFGKDGFTVAEFGVGTNHEARISGQILEDEKVLGTIHVAFGNNIGMGGTCNVGIHVDGVVLKPTVFIDDQKIMENGTLLIG